MRLFAKYPFKTSPKLVLKSAKFSKHERQSIARQFLEKTVVSHQKAIFKYILINFSWLSSNVKIILKLNFNPPGFRIEKKLIEKKLIENFEKFVKNKNS